jgi:hypothetical protein
MTRRIGLPLAALAALAGVIVLAVVTRAPATVATRRTTVPVVAPSATAPRPAPSVVARCEGVIRASQSVLWTDPTVSPAQLEAAGASPSVAREWQSALTPGQIARHDHEVPVLRVTAAGPTGRGVLADLSMTLQTRGGPYRAWWTCRTDAAQRVVQITEVG